jgi:hypothetical protein
MEFLGLPFNTALSTPVRILPFVTREVPPNAHIYPLRRYSLVPELQQEKYLPDSVFLFMRPVPFRMAKRELYVQVPTEATEGLKYERFIGCPVYENGVIFSNFFDEDDGLQKGLVMGSFLQALEQDGLGWPATIIAIDDNLLMLQNMEQVAGELGIVFFGIHYQPPPEPKSATFWVFEPPTREKE